MEFIVHSDYRSTVTKSESISKRIIRIRLNATPRNLSIVQVHVPPSNCNEEVLEIFYNQLETTINTSLNNTSSS